MHYGARVSEEALYRIGRKYILSMASIPAGGLPRVPGKYRGSVSAMNICLGAVPSIMPKKISRRLARVRIPYSTSLKAIRFCIFQVFLFSVI
jgi:hypothetical protein